MPTERQGHHILFGEGLGSAFLSSSAVLSESGLAVCKPHTSAPVVPAALNFALGSSPIFPALLEVPLHPPDPRWSSLKLPPEARRPLDA